MSIKRGTPEYHEQRRRVLAKARSARRRRTHCKRGHELTGSNVRVMPNERRCRRCEAIRTKRWQEAQAKKKRRQKKRKRSS